MLGQLPLARRHCPSPSLTLWCFSLHCTVRAGACSECTRSLPRGSKCCCQSPSSSKWSPDSQRICRLRRVPTPAGSMSSSSASLPRDIIFTLQGKWQVRLAPLSTRDAKQHSDGHGAFYGHSSGSSITSGPSNFTLGYATCILSGEPCSLDDRVRPPSPLPALWCLLHHLMPKGVCFGDRIDLPPAECFAKNFCLCPCLQSPQQLILAPPSCCDNDSRL